MGYHGKVPGGVYVEIESWTSRIRGGKVNRHDAGAVGAALTSGGAAATATAAVACCVPVLSSILVAVLGASGAAWVSGLRPLSPYLLLVSVLLLGYAFRRVYGRRVNCTPESPPTARRVWLGRIVLGLLWLSAVVWAGAVVAYFTLR